MEIRRAAAKGATKRLPVSPFSGLLKGCKGHKTHRFENGGTNQIRKSGKREVVVLHHLPQTLYEFPLDLLFLQEEVSPHGRGNNSETSP